jgi:hypothetical protein
MKTRRLLVMMRRRHERPNCRDVDKVIAAICQLETRSVDEVVATLTAGELERGVPRGA